LLTDRIFRKYPDLLRSYFPEDSKSFACCNCIFSNLSAVVQKFKVISENKYPGSVHSPETYAALSGYSFLEIT